MDYKKFAIDIAKRSGEIIRREFKHGMEKKWKNNETPVTKTDIAINKLVIAGVKKYFPNHDVLGEEESYRPNKGKFLWVCDPVDGTIPFSHGIPICVFSLALVEDGKPILGVVYDPFIDRMFFAQKNKGAFLNGKRIHVNKRQLKNSVVNWESHRSPLNIKDKIVFKMAFCCYIYAAALVACGELVASFCTSPFAHDGASVKILVEEAGGKVTDRFGKEQRYDGDIGGILATNGVVHKEMVKYSKKAKMWY